MIAIAPPASSRPKPHSVWLVPPGEIGDQAQQQVGPGWDERASSQGIAGPAGFGRAGIGKTGGGSDRQQGSRDRVAGIDRRGANGVEAGGEPGRSEQANRDQHQQGDKQHGMATHIASGWSGRIASGKRDGATGDGETDCHGDAVGCQQHQCGSREGERRHPHRRGRGQRNRGGLISRNGGAGQEYDEKKGRR